MTLLDSIVTPEAGALQALGGAGRPALAARRRTAAWSARVFAIAVVGLFALFAGGFAIWQVKHAVVPWDSKNQFYPMFRFLADAIRRGAVPLWNPYNFAGYPAVADPQSLIFTPSMMLFALIAPDASMPVFDGVILAHLFLGGVGVLTLARRWRWEPAAGFLAALVFTMGGSASARLEHTGMIISYIYFPWALWSLGGALARRSFAWAALTGVAVALMAIGRDQVAFMLCLALVAAIVREAVASGTPLAYLRDRSPVLLVAGATTLALMIVPILLTLQYIHDSNRPSITYGVALGGSLNPINLLTLIAPDVFGSIDKIYDYWGPGTGFIQGNDWTDKTDRTIDYMFIGTAPVVLLVWQGLIGGRLIERGARFFAALAVLAILYGLGRHTPVFGLIFDWVPGVSLYRRPADANFAINVGLAFGAGYLLDRFVVEGSPRPGRDWPRGVSWLLAAGVILGGAALIGGGLAFARRYGHFDLSLWRLGEAAALAALVVVALALFRAPRHRAAIALVLVAATAGELLWRNAASALNAESISIYSAFGGFTPDEARGLAILRADLARREAEGEHPRVEMIGVNGSWQNASMVLKIEDTIGYNPLIMSDYERAVGPMESAYEIKLRSFPGLFRGYTCKLAALLGLDYLVLDRPLDRLPRHFPRPRADLLFAGDSFYVYRLDTARAPRVYLATHLKAVNSDEVITDETMPDFDRGFEALIDAKDVGALKHTDLLGDATAGPVGTLVAAATPAGEAPLAKAPAITDYEDNAVTVAVDAPRSGILVLHDLFYLGWTARVDGRAAPVLRTNILFRGVEVPAGRHTVTFRFEPLTLANLAAAAGGLVRASKP